MSSAIANHKAVPVTIARGQGCYLFDNRGRRYLDFMGGWCVGTVGWSHPGMAKAIAQQAQGHFFTVASFRLDVQEQLAEELLRRAPGKMSRVYRCTSGSEAVELAIKCARAATGKKTIIAFDDVYHGHTYGAASLGIALTPAMSPGVPFFEKLPLPKTAEQAKRALLALHRLLRTRRDVAAVMTEPVWTNAGCFIPPADFLPQVEALCREYNVLFIMDEVAAGMGRCGRWYASELWNLTPDIITLGKGLTGGYASLGATLVTNTVYKRAKNIPHYSTFGWCLTDAAATLANIRFMEKEQLVENAAKVGTFLLNELKPLAALRKVKMVRGQGMVLAIEFKLPRAPKVAFDCYRKGLLVEFSDARTLFISPPLALTRAQAKAGATIVKQTCGLS